MKNKFYHNNSLIGRLSKKLLVIFKKLAHKKASEDLALPVRERGAWGEGASLRASRSPHLKQLLVILIIFLPLIANADISRLTIYNYHFNETLEIDENFDDLQKLDHVFRSPDGKEHPISLVLLDLLVKICDHFKVDTIEIISGYRSPEYNKGLKEAGKTVADESLHMQGIAADIHIDEITEEAIWKYVKKLKRGGAGLYPDYNFVHVDLGRVRSWAEPADGERKIISEGTPVFITDKNIYITPSPLTLSPPPNSWRASKGRGRIDKIIFTPPLPEDAVLERFVRGAWQKESTSPLPFGKYRAVSPAGRSNEFYIKKSVPRP